MSKRILAGMLTLLMLAGMLSGCGASEKKGVDLSDGIQIGFSFDSFIIERWEKDRDIFTQVAAQDGAEVIVQDAGGELEEQITQIKSLIERKVDAIVIVATNSEGLTEVVEQAKKAGIYVVSYDRLIVNAELDLYITVDSCRVGELMAETMKENVPKNGRIVCITGSEQDDNVSRLQSGFESGLEGSSLKIISMDYCQGWKAAEAYRIMEEILDSGAEFEGVMCGNDDLAAMVFKALSERGRLDGVCIVGQDAELSACQRIVNGWQSMTVYKPMENLAETAAKATLDLIRTGSAKTQTTVENGWGDIPTILLEPVAVTKENMNEVIIDGGFHQWEEVYSNRSIANSDSQ